MNVTNKNEIPLPLPVAAFALFDSDLTFASVVNGIFKGQLDLASKRSSNGVDSFVYSISNKYYSADVSLCNLDDNNLSLVSPAFLSQIEAFVFAFSTKNKNSFDKVKSWMAYVNDIEPQIRILFCNQCSSSSTEICRKEVLAWCLENNFELVELSPHEDDLDEDDINGYDRIIQALGAHSWPNLVMKDKPHVYGDYMEKLRKEASLEGKLKEETGEGDCSSKDADATSALNDQVNKEGHQQAGVNDACTTSYLIQESNTSSATASNALSSGAGAGATTVPMDNHDMLLKACSDGTEESESFERLFEKMKVMKEQADLLPAEQRKAFAENVVLSFWKAIGGDEEEILGLDDEEETNEKQ